MGPGKPCSEPARSTARGPPSVTLLMAGPVCCLWSLACPSPVGLVRPLTATFPGSALSLEHPRGIVDAPTRNSGFPPLVCQVSSLGISHRLFGRLSASVIPGRLTPSGSLLPCLGFTQGLPLPLSSAVLPTLGPSRPQWLHPSSWSQQLLISPAHALQLRRPWHLLLVPWGKGPPLGSPHPRWSSGAHGTSSWCLEPDPPSHSGKPPGGGRMHPTLTPPPLPHSPGT